VWAGERVDEHRELVAAEPGHHVDAARGAAQPVGHLGEQRVARRVAEGVVDHLEVVEVDVEHRHARGGVGAAARAPHRLEELGAVGEPGERVGEHPRLQLLLDDLVDGDVARDALRARHPPADADGRERHVAHAHRALGPLELGLPRLRPPPVHRGPGPLGGGALGGEHEVAERAPGERLGGAADEARERAVAGQHAPARVQREGGLRVAVEQRAVERRRVGRPGGRPGGRPRGDAGRARARRGMPASRGAPSPFERSTTLTHTERVTRE
jgi:hypothetical protein